MNDGKLSQIQQKVDEFAGAMDDWIRIPGTNVRLGWDPILGLVPGVGDTVTLLIQFYIIAQAMRAGARKRVLLKMLWNIVIDFLVGLIPGIGDLVDIFWKSNRRNAELLKSEIALHRTGRAD